MGVDNFDDRGHPDFAIYFNFVDVCKHIMEIHKFCGKATKDEVIPSNSHLGV